MNKPIMYERFTGEGQTEVTLTQGYAPNTQSIQVFINGMPIDENDYEETDRTTVTFRKPISKGSSILISHLKELTSGIRFGTGDIVGSKATSMFKRYDGAKHLEPNTEYTIRLNILGKDYEWKFTSAYSPSYSTLKTIKADLGKAITDVSDDDINRTIWQNSIDVASLVEEKGAIELETAEGKVNRAVSQWVRYKTDVDLLNIVYISIATNAGSVDKTLGEMRITKSNKIPYLDDLLDYYNKKLAAAENVICGIGVRGKAMVKAGKTEYPISSRRSF